jgi:hypothetical protein
MAFEAAFAIGVLVLAGNLAAASPPGLGRPIEIARAPSTASDSTAAILTIQPGRPGPNRFVVTFPGGTAPDEPVELRLQRTDGTLGSTTVRLQPPGAGSSAWAADAGILPASSTWDAAVVVLAPDGTTESGRARFAFSLDESRIVAGRALPLIDPSIASGGLMLLAALITLGFVVAGGRMPRVEPRVGRAAALVGGASALGLGIAILVMGPPL